VPPDRPPDDRYWLLTGDAPTGPFTVAEVLARLAGGDLAWDTRACPVGRSEWRPLVQTPGIGPVAPAPPADTPAPPAVATAGPTPVSAPAEAYAATAGPTSAPATGTVPRSGTTPWLAVVAVLAAGAIPGWFIYRAVRPDTATEVCQKVDEASTPAEARRYLTPRMYPVYKALHADKTLDDPNDVYEYTREVDDPRPNTRLVRIRGSSFVAALGRRGRIEGHILVVGPGGWSAGLFKTDGWRVDDIVVTAVDGVPLPAPMSFVDEFRRSPPAARAGAKAATPAGAGLDAWWERNKGWLKDAGTVAVGLAIAYGWTTRRPRNGA